MSRVFVVACRGGIRVGHWNPSKITKPRLISESLILWKRTYFRQSINWVYSKNDFPLWSFGLMFKSKPTLCGVSVGQYPNVKTYLSKTKKTNFSAY